MGNCIIFVWCVQTCFRVSQASRQTVFCLPSSGLSSSFSFPTSQKSSSFSGAFSCRAYWECHAKVPRCYWSHALWASAQVGSGAAGSSQSWEQEVVAVLQWQEGPSGRDWEVEQFVDALALRSLRAAPGVWRLPVWGQADDINSQCFSLLGSWSIKTRIPQRTHGTMCGILDSIHQVRAPPPQWAELEAAVRTRDVLLADDREANKACCVDRQELFLYLTSQLLQDKHTWTLWPGFQERDVCTLLLTKSILGLPDWIRSGYRGVGDIRPACLFPLVKSKCFLDSGVRWCCKSGHSCVRRVIGCSSILHKMAWRIVAWAIRTVARLGGPGCEIFDISQLRFELDSTFRELDTPPSRCC